MTDEEILQQFWAHHKGYLLDYAAKAACGNRRDAEEGLNDAVRNLWLKIVNHCKIFGIEDRAGHVPGQKWTLWQELHWRIKSRVLDARRKSLRHEQPLGVPVFSDDALANQPEIAADDSADGFKDTLIGLPEKIRVLANGLSATEKRVVELTVLAVPPISDDEAASIINTTSGTVKARRCDALKKLRHNSIRSCIVKFTPAEQKVIELTVLRGPPMQDVAAALEIGIAPDTVSDIRRSVLEKIRFDFVNKTPNPTIL